MDRKANLGLMALAIHSILLVNAGLPAWTDFYSDGVIQGGDSYQDVYSWNYATVDMTGGEVTRLFNSHDNSTVNFSGGSIMDFLAGDLSVMNMSGGQVNRQFRSLETSTIYMTGGIAYEAEARDYGIFNISGGTVSGEVWTHGNGTVNITGGSFGGSLAPLAGTINIYGHGFNYGYGAITATSGRLSGTLLSGETINVSFHRQSLGTIMLIPEPTTPLLLGLEIVGPDEVAEDSQTQYRAIAHYDNNSTADVTDLADWSAEPNDIADVNAGVLTTEMIDLPMDITITAQYSEGDVNKVAEKQVSVLAICPSGYALDFDGVDDYVEVPDDDTLDITGHLTVSAWVNVKEFPSVPGDGCIIGKYNSETGYECSYRIALETDGRIAFGVSGNGFSWSMGGEAFSSVLAADTWYHVVGVYIPSTSVKIYINGVEDGDDTTSITSSILSGSAPLGIGASGMGDNPANALIDDVRIYDKALSDEEIRANMHRRLTGDEPNLVAYWDFDEGDGQIAADSSLYGNDGQLGSTPDADDSDPAWVDSDAPIGICTLLTVDIKPGSCPNPLDVKSKGVLPVAVLGAEDFDVNTIDPASVELVGVGAIRSNYEDVATPVPDGNECECNTDGPDGYTDLTLKFKTQLIVEAIGDVNDGDVLTLPLTGVLYGERPIEGADCIVIYGKAKSLHGADINKDGVVNFLDFAILAENWLQSSIVDE